MAKQKPKEKSGLMGWYFHTSLLLRIFTALILGAVAGIVIGPEIQWVKPLGDIFVRLLKMIVMPVVLFTLVVGSASIHPSRLGRIGLKSLLLYVFTSALAVGIGVLFANLFSPGQGLQLASSADMTGKALNAPSLIDTFLNIIPTNPFNAISSGKILPTILVAIIFGMGVSHLRESKDERIKKAANTVFSLFEGGAEVMYKVVGWVLEYAPVGVFALIAVVFGKQGAQAFGPLAIVTITVYCAFIFHAFLVYGGMLAFYRINFFKFLLNARAAIVTAFVTRSSGGTLPVSMEVAEEKLGVSKSVYSFSLPLGATLNMDGAAIYQGVCAIFVGLAIGLPLTFSQQMTVIVTAVLASIGSAGVPGAGAIMLLMVLESVGLKIEAGSAVAAAYAMILGVDALLDMGRTALNVTGDLTVTCVVAKTEGELNEQAWVNGDELKTASFSTDTVE
ncbi:dicarboxylate/amino acid:cation symporter [Dethiosulfatarculus sandiegensis]|uniref:Amino acid transporter n=1 Tax=Dethiosulfatarculus sandiegensis TaxID=1429043 RepID=A0A0D2JIV4_9BACT|nr:dicarboxylate/amino acid:cation symporter [Dethiosulfatarculus sandiegensis]KIX15616.1 amino acid transporter [Dethiosulfatarculus sandiegensis]